MESVDLVPKAAEPLKQSAIKKGKSNKNKDVLIKSTKALKECGSSFAMKCTASTLKTVKLELCNNWLALCKTCIFYLYDLCTVNKIIHLMLRPRSEK